MASRVLRMPAVPNRYQKSKGKAIAALLIQRAAASELVTLADLPNLVAHFSETDWRSTSFEAGVPVADRAARIMAIAILQRVAE